MKGTLENKRKRPKIKEIQLERICLG